MLCATARAQRVRKHARQPTKKEAATQPQKSQAQVTSELTKSREDFVNATKDYKKSLEQLIALYEKDVKKAEEKLTQSKELYAEGLISKRDLEASERGVADAQSKITDARGQMVAADERVAEMLVESQAVEQMLKAPPLAPGRLMRTTSYIRYNGAGGWALGDAWKVQRFFQQKFGRALPVSAFGQSAVHDRWGLDHHNAMDVPLNPDGVEGQAVMAFLQSNGIPFSAFRMAIQGSATGPHIHIGRPSHRTGSP